ncbi:MAG: LysR family transcriptional regulator [Sedimentisphaerales bacterium]|nr:LysR family transcriptional regulator [Sedimentisphaerales bacterium]
MHIESFKMFCDLAELRSLSKTAERHVVSQSAVSQQIAQLEASHRCQLINRKKRPIELTRQGELLYKAAKDIISRYEEFKSELNTLKNTTGSRINIAAIFSIGMHSLPEYIKKFMVRYPDVHVHVEYFSAEKIYESVLTGEVDIGLVAVPKRDRHLEVYDFQDEQLVLVCSPKHPLAAESQIDIQSVQFERFIAFEENIPTRQWIDGILKRYGLTIRPVMEFDNIETVKRAIEINSGISILPATSVEQEIAAGTLKALRFTDENLTRPTGIIVRKNKIQTRPGRYFIKLLTEKS